MKLVKVLKFYMASIILVTPVHALNVIQVGNTSDSGPGSLRAAMLAANNDGDATQITFNATTFPEAAPGVITLSSMLPGLTDPNTSIDGTGNGVIISGINLPNDPANVGMRALSKGIVIRGLQIVDFPSDGIRIQPVGDGNNGANALDGILIQNNVLKRNDDGIRVSGQGANNELDVTISGNTIFESNDDGIFVRGSGQNSSDGENTLNIVIDGNSVGKSQGSKVPGLTGDGIRVYGGFGESKPNTVIVQISNNEILDSDDQGIVVKGAGAPIGGGTTSGSFVDVTITGNRIRKSGLQGDGSGISVQGGHKPGDEGGFNNTVYYTVSNNNVDSSTEVGIVIAGGQADTGTKGGGHTVTGTIVGNIVSRHARHGIVITGGRSDGNTVEAVIENNDVKNNTGQGILVIGSSGGQAAGNNNLVQNIDIVNNVTRENGGHGIVALEGNTNSIGNIVSLAGITDNASTSNDSDGIFVGGNILGSGATSITGNVASRNADDGIEVMSTGYELSDNTARNNGDQGIVAVGNSNGEGNVAKGNPGGCNGSGCF